MNKNNRILLLTLKNNSIAKKESCQFILSKRNLILLETLYTNGFIQSFSVSRSSNKIYTSLRYFDNKPALQHLKIFSRVFKLKNLKLLELYKFFNKRFVLFLSTNKGLLTSYSCKKSKISGKCLFLC